MAEIFDLPLPTIKTVIKNFKQRGTIESPPKTGRPRKTTPRQDRLMVIESKRDPWLVAGYVYYELLKSKNMFYKSLVFYVYHYFLEKFEILLKLLINLKRKKVLN